VAGTVYSYSFKDVVATVVGPNGAFSIGSSAGAAKEGITIEMVEDKGTMTIGADGQGMHSLHAGKGGRVTVRLLKNSLTNALLSAMYNADCGDSSQYGQNTIVVSWLTAGDVHSCRQCGFVRFPSSVYSEDGPMLEWTWNSIVVDHMLGAGA
jgi:hypothetical protein